MTKPSSPMHITHIQVDSQCRDAFVGPRKEKPQSRGIVLAFRSVQPQVQTAGLLQPFAPHGSELNAAAQRQLLYAPRIEHLAEKLPAAASELMQAPAQGLIQQDQAKQVLIQNGQGTQATRISHLQFRYSAIISLQDRASW